MRAISTVIASILMLMIVIGLGGTTYLYISGIFTGKTATAFEIIDAVNDTVIIRNSGTEPITRITATLDGDSANIAVVSNIQGLVSYWSFNEGSGITTDDNSYNNNVGTLIDGPSWVDGKYGKALQFDGIGDYVDVGDVGITGSLAITTAITVEAWANPNSISSNQIFVGKVYHSPPRGYAIRISAGTPTFRIAITGLDSRTVTSSDAISVGAWYHIVGTFDGNELKIYINGINKGTTSYTGSIYYEGADMRPFRVGVGSPIDANNENFNGTIDEVRIYNRALSAEEIKQVYSGLVSPGQLASIKPLTSLTKGTHTLRLCTTSMCNTAILTII